MGHFIWRTVEFFSRVVEENGTNHTRKFVAKYEYVERGY
jgi:hypothetical protein